MCRLPIALLWRKSDDNVFHLAMLIFQWGPVSRKPLAAAHDDTSPRWEVNICAYRTSRLEIALHFLLEVFRHVWTVCRKNFEEIVAEEAGVGFGVN